MTDTAAVRAAVAESGASHIIHLAGLQVPLCKASPPLGAAVNVVGTVNILEAARHNEIRGLSYASSLGALGPRELYPDRPIADDVRPMPATLYGVYKHANEECARIYWQDHRLGSVGVRPYNVFGVGRDVGLTADIAKAILATAAGRPFHVRYDGEIALQHASDVARVFIRCARAEIEGAKVCNLRNDVIEVSDFVATLTRMYPAARITFEAGAPLPFPSDLDDSGVRSIIGDVPHIPLEEAIRQDHDHYLSLIRDGRIDLGQLER